MGNDQAYIHGEQSMLKIISDPGEVRVKLCPRQSNGLVDEVDEAVEISLNRTQVNALIRDLRKMRGRVFGVDE